ncbi:hypothetical protein OG946_01120 [Streptomyces sp. NBC_01808]|uniref:hypothetical protein n=1 Tax=Streptomyces sp. NBC_01808 TaxID=2975947 RepID=UPI002DD7EE20|nr:hypothetical protein [Streptomyces sp. NBC_01808]WSA36094.1 hypothetical protein OG946_01120 [Streptomyces sp. NBC_01808]
MAATVLAQLCVRTALRKIGWTRTLGLGALLLGLPALPQALSDHLLPVLLTTALRGAGFGIVTARGLPPPPPHPRSRTPRHCLPVRRTHSETQP